MTRHLPVVTLEHTAGITMQQIAGATSGAVQDEHHRAFMNHETAAARALREAIHRDLDALIAKVRNKELSPDEARSESSATINRLTNAHYIHSLFVYALEHAARVAEADDLVRDYRRRKPRVASP
jgi:hypothetical protein